MFSYGSIILNSVSESHVKIKLSNEVFLNWVKPDWKTLDFQSFVCIAVSKNHAVEFELLRSLITSFFDSEIIVYRSVLHSAKTVTSWPLLLYQL